MNDDSLAASAGTSLPPPPPLSSPPPPSSSPSHRQDPPTTSTITADNTALQEAAAVLEAIGGESHLDGFNLLGVIANPRGSMLALPPSSASTSSSFHGRYNQSQSSSGVAAGGGGGSTSSSPVHHTTTGGGGSSSSDNNNGMLSETYHTLELTLSSVTEQVEALNMVLEDWSRQLLEDSYPSYEDQPPDALLNELPLELQQLQLQSLQSYLEGSGEAAHSFDQRRRQRQRTRLQDDPDAVGHIERAKKSALPRRPSDQEGRDSHHDNDDDGSAAIMAEVEREIPARFFHDAFDLTDPDTFRELLLLETTEQQGLSDNNNNNNHTTSRNGPIQEWFPLPPQDTFGAFLDKVELALLQQVRSKSDAFFEESLRFAQLQEWIESLLTQVVDLQTVVQVLQRDLLNPLEVVPTADAHRSILHELLHVLEAAEDLLHCKGSVGGYLSAQDDLAAIDQIQYGRSLLHGRDDNSRPQQTIPGRDGGRRPPVVELKRLRALESVADQLNQYEHLVVTNLREELVEVFLEWNSSTVSSLYTGNGHSSSASKSSQQVRQRVREIAGALQRCRGLTKTRETYGNRLHEVIRMTVRTIVSEFASDTAMSSSVGGSTVTVSGGATAMSLDRFVDCLDMLFEQLLSMLTAASGVNAFCVAEHLTLHDDDDDNNTNINNDGNDQDSAPTDPPLAIHPSATPPAATTPLASIILSAGDLSSKSVSELLRLRREAHSLITLEEMKRIWDKCLSFTSELEERTGHKASALRSTLLAQAKAFLERKHESNMSALAAALDSERWTQCDVSPERQAALARLCSGRSVALASLSRDADDLVDALPKVPEVEIEGKRYKVVWSCLLLMEMCMADLAAASHFPGLASSIVAKVAELLRLFNTRTTQLVLGAGAIHSTARLKSINAKHLSLVTQCLRLVSCTLPYVRAGLMAQLPPKQHALLSVFDQIKKEYAEHNEKILNKFVTIIGGIVEHGLAPKIRGTDFDARSKIPPLPDGKVACCIFLEGISTNTRKMHQVLASLLPPDHLQDVFSRIFAFVDQKVPDLFRALAAEVPPPNAPAAAAFVFPKTDDGKRRLLLEVDVMTNNLNGLDGVRPWEFTLTFILGKLLEIRVDPADPPAVEQDSEGTGNADSDTNTDAKMKASDRDPHSSEVVSENGTEVSTETLQTEDTILTTDEHNNGDPPNSTEAKAEAVSTELELAIPGAKDEQAEIPPPIEEKSSDPISGTSSTLVRDC